MQPMVIGRPGAVAAAMDDEDVSLRELEASASVSRSTLSNLSRDRCAVAKDKAVRIADALNRPVSDLFVHKDGAPLGAP